MVKKNDFKLDQVQNFYPSPLANATTLYHTEIDSLRNIDKDSATVAAPKGTIQRRFHKAICVIMILLTGALFVRH